LNDCAQFNGEHTTQVHKKALTFGENEIVEGYFKNFFFLKNVGLLLHYQK